VSKKLYELADDFNDLNALVEQGELTIDDIEDTLEAINASIEDKFDATCMAIKNISEPVSAIDDEIKRLQARKKSLKTQEENMKQYMLTQLDKMGKKSVKTALFTVSSRKPTEKIVVDDEAKLPDDCVEVVMETKPLKSKILDLLNSGEEVEGVRVEMGKKSIQIR